MLLLGVLQAQAAGQVAAGSFDLLETQVLASSAASVTFSSLSTYAADYQHLQIRYVAKSTVVSDRLRIKVNNSDANLNRHRLSGNGSTVSSGYTVPSGGSQVVSDRLDGTNFSPGVMDILDFFNTNKNTTFKGLHAYTSPVTDPVQIDFYSLLFRSTAQITSLTFGCGNSGFSNSFVTGSRFSLYGIKAA